jgi:ATP-binding protein involved in chromosome partitioning
MATREEIFEALRQVEDPELRRNIVDLGMICDLSVEDGAVSFTLALTVPTCPLSDQLTGAAREAVASLPGVKQVRVTPGVMTDAERRAAFGIVAAPPPPVEKAVSRVIAVMSGKGGVGKSLVTALLATALARAGYRVGVLDADVTGPSIPKLFGVRGPVTATANNRLQPVTSRTGIKLMSVNFLLEDEDQALIWRGPIVSQAITQFWTDVAWGQLDYLLVDLPPGTSDAALTVMQQLPLDGILMVTTPQSLAAMVVRKAVTMAQAVNVPILGIVENMAGFVAPDTGKRYEIFGPSHSREVTERAGAPLLARLPLDPEMAALSDVGAVESLEQPELDALVRHLQEHLPQAQTAEPAELVAQ